MFCEFYRFKYHKNYKYINKYLNDICIPKKADVSKTILLR
jgi:hypothetical protein